ncbi:hypothetical protein KP509_34G016400 [Ceratopteris richardii]|uniref:Uncharacterized protein n=1 Tax=Ceratopteris richardii TaxID=49495 RepID=A0A8T2QJ29_CERRI|nr:hypothetical protein KP509_34G016400 [Ceratopteris richardii]KAH7283624.1 hypothetical protein KP509_34G016400 [Ceratopteris richardii]
MATVVDASVHEKNSVRVGRSACQRQIVVEIHDPTGGLRLPAFAGLLERQGFSSFHLSTACTFPATETLQCKCLIAEIDAQLSDTEMSRMEQFIINYYS